MDQVRIREAKSKDIEAMISLLRTLFRLEKDFTFCPERQRTGLEMMLHTHRGILLVAERNNKIIGMCSGQLMISTAEGGVSLQVEDVIVDTPWRHQGVGTTLLSALQEWALKKQVLRLQLLADRTNSAALIFYQKLQWQKTQLISLCKRLPHSNPEN